MPDGLREASLALGATEWRHRAGVVLPTARAGLVTAVILGVARAVGETAPLIMTSFGSSVMNANPFSGAQMSLPLYIYRNYQLGLPVAAAAGVDRCAGADHVGRRPVHPLPASWAAATRMGGRRSEAVLEALETAAPAD